MNWGLIIAIAIIAIIFIFILDRKVETADGKS